MIKPAKRCLCKLLMLRIYKWRLWEFCNKKYVLFTTYFMSSFQITWYFPRTL